MQTACVGGHNRVNLLSTFALWGLDAAVAECAVDGVVCCVRALPSGRAEMVPVSEQHPLAECRHFVAGHRLDNALQCGGDSMESFYASLGIVLLGTVMDGDCGIDTACVMLGLPKHQQSAVRFNRRSPITCWTARRVLGCIN